MPCKHPAGLAFDAPDLFPDNPRLEWCTVCGSLLDGKTGDVIAEPVIVKGVLVSSDEIDRLYVRLAELADKPGSKTEYDAVHAELRRLQNLEAEAMRHVLHAWRRLDPDKLKEAVAAAEAFLKENEKSHG